MPVVAVLSRLEGACSYGGFLQDRKYYIIIATQNKQGSKIIIIDCS